jgi:two-component system, sensor histidine kinase
MSGKVLLNKKPLDFAALVSTCLDTFRATGRTAAYKMHVEVPPGWVDGDATRLEQVVCNLIDNALKYTPEGGVIDISTEILDGEVVFTVKDSGVGIGADLLPHVFDVFVQGSISLDRAQGGLGIGLSLVRKLVELHGGSVHASSDGLANGSSFVIRLPRIEAPHMPTLAPRDAAHGASKPRVLLIEDNDDGREMMASMLGAYDFTVHQAADGLAGVAAACANPSDVALVDIGLPGIDGYEVARRLRKNPETRNMRLIALTGYGLAEDQRRVLEAGFDLHLVKPVDLRLLLDALGEQATAQPNARSATA